jgi:hypothetical protein
MKKTAAAAVLAAALAGCTSAAGHAHTGNAGSAHPASHARPASHAGLDARQTAIAIAECKTYAAYLNFADPNDLGKVEDDPAPKECAGLDIAQRHAIVWDVEEPDAPIAIPSGGN